MAGGDTDVAAGTSSSLTQLVRYDVKLLYKAPVSGNVGSTVPVRIELVNYLGTNVSSANLTVQALCSAPHPSFLCY